MTVVKPRRRTAPRPTFDLPALVEAFTEFRRLKTEEAEAKQRHEAIRDRIMPVLAEVGGAHGENGAHRAIELPEPIDGFTKLVRRANVTRSIDVDAAEALAESKGILGDVQTTAVTITGIAHADVRAVELLLAKLEKFGEVTVTTTFDQTKLYAAHQADRELITEKELDDLLVEDVRYSFHPEK